MVLLKHNCTLINTKYTVKKFMFLKTNGGGDEKYCSRESWPFSNPQSLREAPDRRCAGSKVPRGEGKAMSTGRQLQVQANLQPAHPPNPSSTLRQRRLSRHRCNEEQASRLLLQNQPLTGRGRQERKGQAEGR